MTSYTLLFEHLTNGYKAEFLLILALISIFLSISVIITKNPILSVLFLIGLFFTISIYLMVIGLYFIGLSYLLVYVGAVSILFLFILMLINVRISELLTEGRNSLPLAIITILAFSISINEALPYSIYALDSGIQPIFNYIINFFINIYDAFYSNSIKGVSNIVYESLIKTTNSFEIGNISSVSWETVLVEVTHISSIGNILYTNMFILLIVISLILLLAMIGAIVITVKDKVEKIKVLK